MSKIQTITTAGGEKLAVLPVSEYEALIDALDAAQAQIAAAAVARGEMETLAPDQVRALIDAATPLAFWRSKRRITQTDLAKAAGISQSYVAGLESGARKGDPALFLRLARALNVSMESLVVDE
ncbi:MAG: anaerobic benzoate catabolism transcriptional regulator [Hyphomicrobiales bacterium]|nr:anaerobic benzoate catabolism transcriptional regulator [Hyphomicrobiales bacterium]